MNKPEKQYLIERPEGVLLSSGLTSKETARIVGTSRQHLPLTNESKEINGFHVEAFPVKEIEINA